MKLTTNEIKFMNAMRANDYNDSIEGYDGTNFDTCFGHGTWTYTAMESSGLTYKQCTGVVNSLIKKGLIGSKQFSTRNFGDEDLNWFIWFTEEGAKLFINADGEECPWGGLKLLKVEEPKKQKVVEVIVYTFTGMKIQGTHKASLNKGIYTVEFNNGVTHTFDSKTMKQLDSKNEKFANRIELA